ncbi:hypothetical protein XENOCAPTIV_030379 [Xenoophorus captivus]|uniref:Uncharacterized protein n=1 Tax=Xenoophorus captivus TaxID=1517983 RepID=A0ABV0QFC5_9TELE
MLSFYQCVLQVHKLSVPPCHSSLSCPPPCLCCVCVVSFSLCMYVFVCVCVCVCFLLPAPLRKAKFVESPRIPQSQLGSPTHTSATTKNTDLDTYCPGESSHELGPPPSVDEAANTLMTRLGFLLGDKVSEGPAGSQYSMEEPEARQVTFFLSSTSKSIFEGVTVRWCFFL